MPTTILLFNVPLFVFSAWLSILYVLYATGIQSSSLSVTLNTLKEVVSLHLSALLECNQSSDFCV